MRARIPKQGGAQDMNAMIRQAQKMQDKITELQEDIEARDFTASVGGGAVCKAAGDRHENCPAACLLCNVHVRVGCTGLCGRHFTGEA